MRLWHVAKESAVAVHAPEDSAVCGGELGIRLAPELTGVLPDAIPAATARHAIGWPTQAH